MIKWKRNPVLTSVKGRNPLAASEVVLPSLVSDPNWRYLIDTRLHNYATSFHRPLLVNSWEISGWLLNLWLRGREWDIKMSYVDTSYRSPALIVTLTPLFLPYSSQPQGTTRFGIEINSKRCLLNLPQGSRHHTVYGDNLHCLCDIS